MDGAGSMVGGKWRQLYLNNNKKIIKNNVKDVSWNFITFGGGLKKEIF